MKPKPFSPLNHLTVPCAMKHLLDAEIAPRDHQYAVGRRPCQRPRKVPGAQHLPRLKNCNSTYSVSRIPTESTIRHSTRACPPALGRAPCGDEAEVTC